MPITGPMDPLVTCLIAAHNAAQYVDRAVLSALGQTGMTADLLEVLVIDDGSTDKTAAVLAAFGDAITVVRQENAGPAVATNRGIAIARGRYTALLDADDEWLPDKLAQQLELFRHRPEVALVHGDMEVIDGAGNVVRPSLYDWYGILPVVGRALGRLLEANEVTTTLMVRTDLARATPPAPKWAWCRDWWIAAHLAAGHEIDAVRDPVARYRVHGENFSPHNGGVSERTVRLWERDIRMRRLLMCSLDLSTVTLNQLAIAWAQLNDYVGRVAQARGIGPADVVPVTAQARAISAVLRDQGQILLETDPTAAGRLAARAMVHDPFAAGGSELLEAARARPCAATTPAPPSAGHNDRLRELVDLQEAVTVAIPRSPAAVLARLRRLERARASIAAGAPPGLPLPAPTGPQRERAFAAISEAVAASDAGDHVTALVASAGAIAFDPSDGHSKVVFDNALAVLGGVRTRNSERDDSLRARFQAPPKTVIGGGAGAFVALADAEELIARPSLLRAWSRTFRPEESVTLAIVSADEDLALVHERLADTLAGTGLHPDGEYDLALVPATPSSPADIALAAAAHAVVTNRPREALPGWLAGHPTAGDGELCTLRALAERRWTYDGARAPLGIAIKICAPSWGDAGRWGDTHFARALADELTRRGHTARIDVLSEWDDRIGPGTDDLVVHLRGLSAYVPRKGQFNVLWNISHPDLLTAPECDAFDLIATPSLRRAEELTKRTATPVVLLEQATDPMVFFPQPDAAHAHELVFVGNSRGIERPILRDLLPTSRDLVVWGQHDARVLPPRYVAGSYLPNDQVRRAYSSAAIVLNDHWDDMRAEGLICNRVYDALACGACVVSDDLPELHERFGDAIVTYRTPEQLRAQIDRLLADPAERAQHGARGRAQVLEQHTFRHRVDVLLDAVNAQLAPVVLKDERSRPIVGT